MATLRSFLPLSLLAAAALAPAQYLSAEGTYRTTDPDPALTETRYAGLQETTGPIVLDHAEAFVYGASTFTGFTRASVDYGRIGLYASTFIDNRLEAAEENSTGVYGAFMDPLTISGGAAGATIHAEFNLRGTFDVDPLRSGYAYGTYLHFQVYNETMQWWEDAEGETLTYRNDGSPQDSLIDFSAVVTLQNYDPTRSYALVASAEVRGMLQDASDSSSGRSIVDAEHTATVSQIGFVSPNGLYGTFTGHTGFVYANPVPEPASFLALGAGLAVLRRARRPKTS